MIQTALSIVIILLHHQAVQCQICIECDPDIPSRQTPRTREDWYQDTTLNRLCKAGHYLDHQNLCKPCLVGTFMTEAMASTRRYNFCPACMKVSAVDAEEVVKECTFDRDTEIYCKGNYYREIHCNCSSQCRRCSTCGVGSQQLNKYEFRPCSQLNDTLCCAREDDLVVGNECVSPTTTAATTTFTEQKPAKNPNSAEATEILSTTVLIGFLTLFIL